MGNAWLVQNYSFMVGWNLSFPAIFCVFNVFTYKCGISQVNTSTFKQNHKSDKVAAELNK